MRSKLHFGWSDLKTLVPRKNQPVPRTEIAGRHFGPLPTLLLRANRYRGFGLYVVTDSGPVPVFREGTATWFKSIEECTDELLDLGMWDCHMMPPRADEPPPARPQCSRFARSSLRLLRPLGAR